MNLPNKLTLLRIILIPFFMLAFYLDFTGHYLVSLGIFAVAAITDFFDGYIARKYNMVTDMGKFLDPIADKVLVMSALVLLCVEFTGTEGLIVVICTIIILAREFIISGFRLIAAGKNLVLAADKLGKAKTVMQMISLVALLITPFAFSLYGTIIPETPAQFPVLGIVVIMIGLASLVIATLLAILSAINYISKNSSVLKENK